MMDREQLGKMKLEALRTLAAESGLEGAQRLGKTELIDHLAPPKLVERAKEAIVHAVEAVEHKAHELIERVRHPHAHSADHDERHAPTVVAAPVAGEAIAMEVVAEDGAATPVAKPAANGSATAATVKAKSADGRAHHGSNGFGVPSATVHPQPQSPPRASEPIGMLDFEELPEHYGVDECEVLDKDPFWVFAYWEVTDRGLAAARGAAGRNRPTARGWSCACSRRCPSPKASSAHLA